MEKLVEFTIGDWSRDGHNQFDVFFFKSSLDVEGLRAAYLVAVEKTGIDLRKILNQFNEDDIEEGVIDELSAIGVLVEGDGKSVMASEFIQMLIAFIRIGDPDVQLEHLVPETFNKKWGVDQWGMGYGLFS